MGPAMVAGLLWVCSLDFIICKGSLLLDSSLGGGIRTEHEDIMLITRNLLTGWRKGRANIIAFLDTLLEKIPFKFDEVNYS